MSGIILPEVVQAREQIEASLEALGAKRERAAWLQHFDSALRAIDPKLSLEKAREQVQDRAIMPGYWHVRRQNGDDLPDTWLPIAGDDGEFIEPHMGILEGLRANDLQRPGRLDELRKQWDRQDAERANRTGSQRAQIREEFMERYVSNTRPSVGFGDDRWTNSVHGRRGASS